MQQYLTSTYKYHFGLQKLHFISSRAEEPALNGLCDLVDKIKNIYRYIKRNVILIFEGNLKDNNFVKVKIWFGPTFANGFRVIYEQHANINKCTSNAVIRTHVKTASYCFITDLITIIVVNKSATCNAFVCELCYCYWVVKGDAN